MYEPRFNSTILPAFLSLDKCVFLSFSCSLCLNGNGGQSLIFNGSHNLPIRPFYVIFATYHLAWFQPRIVSVSENDQAFIKLSNCRRMHDPESGGYKGQGKTAVHHMRWTHKQHFFSTTDCIWIGWGVWREEGLKSNSGSYANLHLSRA